MNDIPILQSAIKRALQPIHFILANRAPISLPFTFSLLNFYYPTLKRFTAIKKLSKKEK